LDLVKMKIRGTTSIGFDFECYPGHDPEQYLRGLAVGRTPWVMSKSIILSILSSLITRNVFNEKEFYYSVLKNSLK